MLPLWQGCVNFAPLRKNITFLQYTKSVISRIMTNQNLIPPSPAAAPQPLVPPVPQPLVPAAPQPLAPFTPPAVPVQLFSPNNPVPTIRDPAGTPQQAILDERGFDVNDFHWFPVPRTQRSDGWSFDQQKKFIAALADTGSVTDAAKEVNMSVGGAYKLRRQPGGESFAAAWDVAIAQAASRLVDVAFDRAMNGVEVPVVDKDGNFVYYKRQFNDRLLMFLLRAHRPERYAPGAQTPAPAPIEAAIVALAPVIPENPQLLMSPEMLDLFLPDAMPPDDDWVERSPEAAKAADRRRAATMQAMRDSEDE